MPPRTVLLFTYKFTFSTSLGRCDNDAGNFPSCFACVGGLVGKSRENREETKGKMARKAAQRQQQVHEKSTE